MSWLRPARGWSWDGSGREAAPRKSWTSGAVVDGLKAVDWKVEVEAGSRRVSLFVGEAEEEEALVFLPVRVPQIDMVIKTTWSRKVRRCQCQSAKLKAWRKMGARAAG